MFTTIKDFKYLDYEINESEKICNTNKICPNKQHIYTKFFLEILKNKRI